MGANAELAGFGGAGRRVADHFHRHNGAFGEDVEDGGRVSEPKDEDLPDGEAQGGGVLVIGPYGGVEGFFGEVGRPLIGAVEAWGLDDGVFAADVEGLVGVAGFQHIVASQGCVLRRVKEIFLTSLESG